MSVTKSAGFVQSWQAEWSYEDSGEGQGASVVAKYDDDADGWEARVPARGSVPPAEVGAEFSEFRRKGVRASRQAGEKVEVSVTYESRLAVEEDPGPDEVKRYSMQITLSEEPLLTHPRYADVPEDELTALTQIIAGQVYKTEEGKERWSADVVTVRGLEALEKIDKGVVAYLDPKLIWRESYRIDWKDLDEEVEVAAVGNIDAAVPGDPPTGGDRNYLYIGAQADQDESGEFGDLVNQWQLSGRDGFDEDLYNEEEN